MVFEQGIDLNNVIFVEYSLLGISQASEFYKPTFRNSVLVPSSWVGRNDASFPPTQEDGTDTEFRNVGL
jgi:hypothetical protein